MFPLHCGIYSLIPFTTESGIVIADDHTPITQPFVRGRVEDRAVHDHTLRLLNVPKLYQSIHNCGGAFERRVNAQNLDVVKGGAM